MDENLFEYTWGPCGACPTQAEGVLTTGETFYFRFRSAHASIVIYDAEGTEVAKFVERTTVGDGYFMTAEQATAFVSRWVACYVAGAEARRN